MPVVNANELTDILVKELRLYMKNAGVDRLTVGVSGGVDSALVLALSALAAGKDNVTAVYIGLQSSEESLSRARLACESVSVPLIEVDTTSCFLRLAGSLVRAAAAAGADSYQALIDREDSNKTVLGGFKSCFRAPILRYMNRLLGNGLVVGTGNRDEDQYFRFFQKGGDGEVDCNIVANLSKGEVRQLALHLGVPSEIVMAIPTPDLWGVGDEHSDEEELTAASGGVRWTYSTIDENGNYTALGTMEGVALWIDSVLEGCPLPAEFTSVSQEDWNKYGITEEHVRSVLHWEKVTRHKMNPNLPSGPSRESLVQTNVITNDVECKGNKYE